MNDMFTRLKNICAFLLAITLVSSCGGSGGGGGGITPPPPPPPTGGITRTGVAIAVGPITGFGSVIVNGVRYDTASAMFSKDGVAAVQSDFSVGQFVVVTGTIDDDNTNAVATSVDYESILEGPIGSITPNGFVALGQTVIVGAETSIDDSCADPLVAGVNVEVSGSILDNGDIDASRFECKAVLLEMEVKGKVSGLDSAAMTFQINALTVDYNGITPRDFPGGAISDGDPVEAKGTNLVSGPPLTLTATDVEFKGPRFGDDEGDHVEVEGFITDFVSATDFAVSDVPVTTDPNTTYEPAGFSASDLGPNLKVEVEGEFNSAGLLLATKIDFKQAKNIRVTGQVDTADEGTNTLVILGITISTDPNLTRLEDKTDADVDPLRIADIVPGDYVEVRGQEFPADSGIVAAVILERDDPPSVPGEETELRGFVEVGGLTRPTLTILGVTITADDVLTDFFDDRGSNEDVPMTADEFWAAVAEGSLVDADGTETSVNAMFADELELED
jgi:hypothetical protein